MRLRGIIVSCVLFVSASGPASAAESAKKSTKATAPAKAAAPAKRTTVTYTRNSAKAVAGAVSAGAIAATHSNAAANDENNGLDVKSSSAMVFDVQEGRALFAKNIDQIASIASITKLMTAMVVLDAGLPLDEAIRIERADIDTLKHTGSRLRIGSAFTRRDLLHLALMSSENRAASALGRNYPGGLEAFVGQMNARASELGMVKSRFVEPTGLSSANVSTAEELALLVRASLDYPLIREFSTARSAQVYTADTKQAHGFGNSNGLVSSPSWQIDVSKTGYIAESGLCLVMHARITERPVIIVLLDSWGKYTRIGDAIRIKKWMETSATRLTHTSWR